MAITSLTIENFKGIAEAVTVPIRPITLLFGKNSAGKSTVLQALHYVREVLEHRRPDPDRTQMGGDYIDLGGFLSLVHRNERDRLIRIRIEFDIDDDGIPAGNRIDSLPKDAQESWSIIADLNDVMTFESAWVEIITAWEMGKGAYVAQYSVGLNGEELVRMQQNYGLYPESLHIEFSHPVIRSIIKQSPIEDGKSIDEISSPFALSNPILLHAQNHIIPDHGQSFLVEDDFFNADYEFTEKLRVQGFRQLIDQALTGPLAVLLHELRGIRYLGPIREVPPRNFRTPKTPDESRWAKGLGAWDAMARDALLTEKVSQYMQERLALGYTIDRQERVSLDINGEIVNNLRMIVGRFEDAEADELAALVLDPIERLPRQTVIQLHDEINHIDIEPSDIGVGISQIVPVVAGALDRGTKEHPCRFFAVEQPELHVHPAVQVALGDVFIDAVTGSGRTVLIETHSEHLLLRLLRRVRETSDSKTEPQDRPLTPDMLSVIYVSPTPDGVVFTPLSVTSDGDFNDLWPEGFFAERDSELF